MTVFSLEETRMIKLLYWATK